MMHTVYTTLESPKAIAMAIILRYQADTVWQTVTKDSFDIYLALAKIAGRYRLHDFEEESDEFKVLLVHMKYLDVWLLDENGIK